MKLIIELPEGSKELINENTWVADSLFDKVVRLALQHSIPYEERPHGEWENICTLPVIRKCSLCGVEQCSEQTIYDNFCPNCGADMRGKKNE